MKERHLIRKRGYLIRKRGYLIRKRGYLIRKRGYLIRKRDHSLSDSFLLGFSFIISRSPKFKPNNYIKESPKI